jgi:trehalose-6-phosphate synthase
MIEALNMPLRERRERHTRFVRRVEKWTGRDWLNAQLADLRVGHL